jgi:hypothetical protein
MRLRGYHSHFTKVLPRVVHPAMTTKEARGQRGYVQALAFMTSKYSSVGVLFLVVPMMVETEAILGFWLREVPPDSAPFVRVTMLWATIYVLASGVDQAIFAQGAVRGYGLMTLAVWIGSIALSAFWLFGLGLGPMWLPWTYVGATLVHLGVTLFVGAERVGLSARRWVRETLVPVAAPAVPGTLAALGVHAWLPAGWLRVLAVVAAYALASAPFTWWWSVGPPEKRAFAHGLGRLRKRLERNGARRPRGDTPPLPKT